MSEWINFNLNQTIKVRLSEDGIKHLKTKIYYDMPLDEDGLMTFQMWHFIEIFGEVTHLGMNHLYDNNVLLNLKS